MTAEHRKLGAIMLAMVMVALGSGAASTLASYRLAEQGRMQSERKMCEVLKLSTDNGRRQLDAYDREPPTTPAGKEQRDQMRVAFDAVNRLAQSYGCAEAK